MSTAKLRRMSLDQLEYFVAIAEEENIGRAARRLNISQPPLSRQLHALESELGTTLFQRTPRGVTLLPQGKLFLDHARQILSQVEAAKRALEPQAARPTPLATRPAVPPDSALDSALQPALNPRPSARAPANALPVDACDVASAAGVDPTI